MIGLFSVFIVPPFFYMGMEMHYHMVDSIKVERWYFRSPPMFLARRCHCWRGRSACEYPNYLRYRYLDLVGAWRRSRGVVQFAPAVLFGGDKDG